MKNKRILSAVVAALTATSLSLSITAETVKNGESAHAVRNSEIASCLGHVEPQKELWGIGNVDFEDLYLGEAVQTYEYLKDGFSPCITMYPLIYGDDIVLWAIEADDSYQITTELTYSINDYIDADTEFSIVYADDGSYLYTDGEFIMLSEYDYGDSDREVLGGDENGGTLVLSSLLECEPLNYYWTEAYAVNDLYECDVDYIEQGHNLCWAAACASIINYKKGTNYDSYDVNNYFTSYNPNDGNKVYTEDIPYVLSLYGLSYSYKSVAPGAQIVLKNIKADYPIYGGFADYTKPVKLEDGTIDYTRHGAVLYGIYTSRETIYIMDPNYGFTYSNPSSLGEYSYYASGYTWTLERGVCHVW